MSKAKGNGSIDNLDNLVKMGVDKANLAKSVASYLHEKLDIGERPKKISTEEVGNALISARKFFSEYKKEVIRELEALIKSSAHDISGDDIDSLVREYFVDGKRTTNFVQQALINAGFFEKAQKAPDNWKTMSQLKVGWDENTEYGAWLDGVYQKLNQEVEVKSEALRQQMGLGLYDYQNPKRKEFEGKRSEFFRESQKEAEDEIEKYKQGGGIVTDTKKKVWGYLNQDGSGISLDDIFAAMERKKQQIIASPLSEAEADNVVKALYGRWFVANSDGDDRLAFHINMANMEELGFVNRADYRKQVAAANHEDKKDLPISKAEMKILDQALKDIISEEKKYYTDITSKLLDFRAERKKLREEIPKLEGELHLQAVARLSAIDDSAMRLRQLIWHEAHPRFDLGRVGFLEAREIHAISNAFNLASREHVKGEALSTKSSEERPRANFIKLVVIPKLEAEYISAVVSVSGQEPELMAIKQAVAGKLRQYSEAVSADITKSNYRVEGKYADIAEGAKPKATFKEAIEAQRNANSNPAKTK